MSKMLEPELAVSYLGKIFSEKGPEDKGPWQDIFREGPGEPITLLACKTTKMIISQLLDREMC